LIVVLLFLFYYVKQKLKTKEALFVSFLYLFFIFSLSFLAEKIQRKDKVFQRFSEGKLTKTKFKTKTKFIGDET